MGALAVVVRLVVEAAAPSAPVSGKLRWVRGEVTDRRGERRVVLIFAADRASELSKRPGTSYRGVLTQIKRGNLWIMAGGRTHGISLEKKTRLVDADGSALATGRKEIAGLLPNGADVVVKYEDDGGLMLIGETMVAAGSDQAREVRRLR